MNQLWEIIHHVEQNMTIIASSWEEAIKIAKEHYGQSKEEPNAGIHYVITRGPNELVWVSFDSLNDRENQLADLLVTGVNINSIWLRNWFKPGHEDIYWDIGAKAKDWARLSSGYLCGGPQ